MKCRTQFIQNTHHFLSEQVQHAAVSSPSTLDKYLLTRGLIHTLISEGSNAVKNHLLNLDFLSAAFQSEENPYWISDLWLAIYFGDPAQYYLEIIKAWSDEECQSNLDKIAHLQQIFVLFNWQDPMCHLYRVELQGLAQTMDIQSQEYQEKEFFYHYLIDTPNDFYPRAVQELDRLTTANTNSFTIRQCLRYLQNTCVDLGNLSEARQFGERRIHLMMEEYGAESIQVLRARKDMQSVYFDLGEVYHSQRVIQDWFAAEIQQHPKPTLLRAKVLLEMADLISWDEEQQYQCIDYLKEALDIFESQCGQFHQNCRVIHHTLQQLYANSNQLSKALESWHIQERFIARYFSEESGEMLDHHFHRIQFANVTSPYNAYEELCDLYSNLDHYSLSEEELAENQQRILYFIITIVRDADRFQANWVVDKGTKKEIQQYFQAYCTLVTVAAKTLEEQNDFLTFQINYFHWMKQRKQCLQRMAEQRTLIETHFGSHSSKFHEILESHQTIFMDFGDYSTAYQYALKVHHHYIQQDGLTAEFTISSRYQIFVTLDQWGRKAPISAVENFREWQTSYQTVPSNDPAWLYIYFWWASAYDDLFETEKALELHEQRYQLAIAVLGYGDYQVMNILEDYILQIEEENDTFDLLCHAFDNFQTQLPADHHNLQILNHQLIEYNPKSSQYHWIRLKADLLRHPLYTTWHHQNPEDSNVDWVQRSLFLETILDCLITTSDFDTCQPWIAAYHDWFDSEQASDEQIRSINGDLTCQVIRYFLHQNDILYAQELFNKHLTQIGNIDPPMEPLLNDAQLQSQSDLARTIQMFKLRIYATSNHTL